ncbi:MAG: UDP-N-acetylmuramate--L-alanine ligase [Bacteroidota bacterium]
MPVNLHDIRYVYFLGIGGIGMSAIARWFRAAGVPVWGYDKTQTPLCAQLEAEGCNIHYEDNIALIPAEILNNPGQSLIVWTPAVPKDHTELNLFSNKGFLLKKRAEVLGIIASGHKCVAVAGTHGKTTTSSMIAHLLRHAGRNVTAFLGGITVNYQSNLLLSSAPASETILVAEADEFDRSFLHLHPDIAVITAADADHLDIYGSAEALTETFGMFASQVKPGGHLFMRQGLGLPVPEGLACISYGLEQGTLHAGQVRVIPPVFQFPLYFRQSSGIDELLADITLQMPGYHNVENAVAAAGVAFELGLSRQEVEQGLGSYLGVKRRFEYIVQTDACIYIDDYAHHPTEIEAFLKSVRALYPDRKLTCIFQPHLFTRTRDFMAGFAEALSLPDELILTEIYPAREKPLEGINSTVLLSKINLDHKQLMDSKLIPAYLKLNKPELLVTVGAGDIDRLINPLKVILEA